MLYPWAMARMLTFPVGVHRKLYQVLHVLLAAGVGREPGAGAALALELLGRRLQLLLVAAGEHHLGSRQGVARRQGASQGAGGAGDNGYLVPDGKQVFHKGFFNFDCHGYSYFTFRCRDS